MTTTTGRDPRDPLAPGRLDEILGRVDDALDPAPPSTSERILAAAGPDTGPGGITVEAVEATAGTWERPSPPAARPHQRPFGAITGGAVVAAVGIIVAALIMALLGVGPGAAPAHAATVPSAVNFGGACSAPLSHGRVMVTRTTARIGDGVRRYYTSVTLATTGNPYRLVVDRGVGADPIAGVITRVQRGVSGDVYGVRSWGFASRTKTVNVHVAAVDLKTGRYAIVSC